MNKFHAALAAVVVLAGCEAAEVTQPPVEVSIKSTVPSERILGFTEPVIRAYVRKDGNQSEIIGARCTFDSAEISGDLVTPAIVRMPIFKRQPTTLRMACATPELAGNRNIGPQLNGTAVGGASPAGLVVGLVTASIVAAQDKWSYGANNIGIGVQMEPKAAE
ncbi:MAG: hypothetical protein AAFP16_15375 [Pseudomonadota bacterium]